MKILKNYTRKCLVEFSNTRVFPDKRLAVLSKESRAMNREYIHKFKLASAIYNFNKSRTLDRRLFKAWRIWRRLCLN